jgi:DNA-binding NtrC family response regulator
MTNVRLSFRMTLETEGHEIFEAHSREQAVQLLAEHSFALAILDVRMPGMDGLELLAKLRESGIRVPAVVVTAHGDVPHAVKALKLGAIDFLEKPLHPEDFRNIVAEILDRHARQNDSPVETFSALLVAAKRCLTLHAFAKARLHLAKALHHDACARKAARVDGLPAEIIRDSERCLTVLGLG